GRWGGTVPADFRPRFVDAYDAEVQAWVAAVADGSFVAPRSATAWDGYAAAAVCEAAERSLTADGAVEVTLQERPRSTPLPVFSEPGPSSLGLVADPVGPHRGGPALTRRRVSWTALPPPAAPPSAPLPDHLPAPLPARPLPALRPAWPVARRPLPLPPTAARSRWISRSTATAPPRCTCSW